MRLGLILGLMSLGVRFLCVSAAFGDAFDEFGERLVSLCVGLEQGLGDEFGVDFDEFDEFGGVFLVCSLHLEMCLMSLGARLMSLGVGLDQEFGDEFGVDFDEFDEFGCVCCVVAAV